MKRAAFIILIVLCLPLVVAFAETPDIYPQEETDTETEGFFVFTDAEDEPAPSPSPVAPFDGAEPVWNYPISREILEDPEGILVLVNRENLLDKAFVPHDLVDITARKRSSGTIQARQVASDALQRLIDAADADGLTLVVDCGYRTYRTQEVLHYNRVKSLGYDDGIVQLPGASEHQTGMAFDIISKSWSGKFNRRFATTKEGLWLAENCARFGFILRYPDGKQDITGIEFESWHFRYVGAEAAAYITENGLTLEEFTMEWRSALFAYDDAMTRLENTDIFTFE